MDNIEEKLLKAIDKAFKADLFGEERCAFKEYKGASILIMLELYASILSKYKERECSCDFSKFKLDCVEKNLACLGKAYKIDYVTIWKKLKVEYGLDCNGGISHMIIKEGCPPFIVS